MPSPPSRTPQESSGGWNDRTLSRSVATSAYGPCWLRLRLASAPTDKAGGKLWDGPQDAESLIPHSVPRPRLHRRQVWDDGTHGYLAELYEAVTVPTITTDSPVLQVVPPLDSLWWAALARSLTTIATVPTRRVAVRQEYLHRAMPEYLGTSIDSTVREWSTAHGDLHWASAASACVRDLYITTRSSAKRTTTPCSRSIHARSSRCR